MRLRPFQEGDAEVILSWITSEEEYYQWSAGMLGSWPVTREGMLRTYRIEDEGNDFHAMTACNNELKPIGHLFVRYPCGSSAYARLGAVIIDPALRGTGTGRQMLQKVIRQMTECMGAKEIRLRVFLENTAALRCYESVGFVRTGEREIMKFRNGESETEWMSWMA